LIVHAVALLILAVLAAAPRPAKVGAAWVYFSPRGGCQSAVVASVDAARRSVRVLAYTFTARPVADALLRARARGVDVAVVVDRSMLSARGSMVGTLSAAGVPVLVDAAHPIAHNKVVVIDAIRVLTGSYNYSAQAESNGENLCVLDSRDLAGAYLADWARHAAHSGPARPPAAGPLTRPVGVVDSGYWTFRSGVPSPPASALFRRRGIPGRPWSNWQGPGPL
jgi:phosphatidylserine/phosphatidylglycerophosphate/cardiolipin synthase-like enzyme